MSAKDSAQEIGRQKAWIAITAGLVIAYLIMALIDGDPLWIFSFDSTLNLLFGALLLYVFGYYLGGISGKLILLEKYPALLVGLISGILMTGLSTFIAGFVGFFGEGLQDGFGVQAAFEDYVIKPVLMVWAWGFLPIVVAGLWYGWAVKGRKLGKAQD